MLPKVVIVGRPNVGKSSLLNLLAGRRVSIVDPTAGVTRDRIGVAVELSGVFSDGSAPNTVELIDTGGYGIEDADNLTAQVERQIDLALAGAQVVLFVIDAQAGVASLDETVARLLHQSANKAPVLLVANKVDSETYVAHAQEAAALGFGEPICVSATSSFGKHELLETIASLVEANPVAHDDEAADESIGFLMAIVGKRNAGKSTLVNALAGAERMIVSEVEGTTRDSVDVCFEHHGRAFTAIDTAGVRKRKSVKNDIEYYSMHRALRSVRRADVVLLLLDASVPVSQVDRQLVGEIVKHHRPCIIVVNKWDLAESKHTQEEFAEYLDDALKGLHFAPIAFISAHRSEGLDELIETSITLYEQAGERVGAGLLNRLVEGIVMQRAPVSKVGKRPKIYYVAQSGAHPPTLMMFVNDPGLFDGGYQRFLINRLRDELPYGEVPIQLLIRPRKRLDAEARQAMRE